MVCVCRLDATGFDPVEYLNETFTTERSLAQLEPFVADVAQQIARLDDEISRAVHAQAEALNTKEKAA